MKDKITIDQVDQLLPQTQCKECQYDGCRPYATAIIEQGETINHCPPGGEKTLLALAELLHQDATPYLEEVREKTKADSLALIREDECIGCTKCIQACPTDAILGTGKMMHTILTDACTGCELCIPPCPVDCIDMIDIPERSIEEKKLKANHWRTLHNQRNQRLERLAQQKQQKHSKAKQAGTETNTLAARKAAIKAAVERAKKKKS